MIAAQWPGQSELRSWELEPWKVQAAFIKLVMEIINHPTNDWHAVYKKHYGNYQLD